MKVPDFYLASSEGYGFETPRKAYKVKNLKGSERDDFYLIKIDPPIIGQRFGTSDIEELIIVPRHEGVSLHNITEYPVYVHVARPLIGNIGIVNSIKENEIESIGWAELYKTEQDAKKSLNKYEN